MSIKDRLRLVIEQQNTSIKSFAETMGIPLRTIHNYISGEREPSAEILIKIATELNVDLNWLLLGKGQIYVTEIAGNLTAQEQNLLKQFNQCNKVGKKAIEVSIKAISAEKLFNE